MEDTIKVFNMFKHLVAKYEIEEIIFKWNNTVLDLFDHAFKQALFFNLCSCVPTSIENFDAINQQSSLSPFCNHFSPSQPKSKTMGLCLLVPIALLSK